MDTNSTNTPICILTGAGASASLSLRMFKQLLTYLIDEIKNRYPDHNLVSFLDTLYCAFPGDIELFLRLLKVLYYSNKANRIATSLADSRDPLNFLEELFNLPMKQVAAT